MAAREALVLTITLILVLAALIGTILSAMGKCPLWLPVFLLAMLEALRILPR